MGFIKRRTLWLSVLELAEVGLKKTINLHPEDNHWVSPQKHQMFSTDCSVLTRILKKGVKMLPFLLYIVLF